MKTDQRSILCRSVFWFCSVVIRGKGRGRGRAPCSGVEKCGGNAFRRPNPAALLGCFRRIGHYFLVFFREKKEIPGFLWQCWPQFGILRLYGVEPAAWLRPKTRAAARRGHASAGGVPRRRTTCTNPTHAAQPDRRPLWEALILAALLALFLAIQLPKLDSVPWDQYESWRQSDTYSIAVNYVQYGMDLLHPQLNYDGVSENYAQLELQIVPYLSALVFQLTGTMTPVVPRLLCMLFFLGSAWFLYRLMRGISGRWPALVGLGIYLFLPLSMMTAHVIQPEACALFFYCGGVWLLWRFQQTRRLAFLWGASAMTAVAIMEKTPVAFVGLVFLYVLFSLGGLACLRSPVFYGCGLLTLGPPVALILYTSHHSVFRFVDGIGLKHIFSKEILSIFTAEGQQFFWEALPSRFGWGAVILGCVGLFFAVRRKLHFYGVWALAFALECVTIVAVIRFPYYLVFLLPLCGALSAVAVQSLARLRLPLAAVACAAVAVTTVQGNLALWPQTQADPIIAEVGQFIQAHTQPDEGVAIGVNNPSYLNAANRRGYRANIAYYDYIPTGPEAEVTYFIEHGVRWFVVVQGWVYNDEDGAYRTYLREQFPVAATGTNCVIYDLQGE